MKHKDINIASSGAKTSVSKGDKLELARTLIELNSLEVDLHKASPKRTSRRAILRKKLPTQILIVHDELIALGRCSLAPRILGKCGECSKNVKPTTSLKSDIAKTLVPCTHCGTLLYG